ncbi:MAG: hypothetical protein J7494_01010 [Sphingobium sp.]|nr:hypothetical protein [Sphingobium sp.]
MTYATAATVLTGWACIFAYVLLKGWNGWLALKRAEMEMTVRHMPAATAATDPAMPSAATRIDMADLKERVRKLEAIASGVDL